MRCSHTRQLSIQKRKQVLPYLLLPAAKVSMPTNVAHTTYKLCLSFLLTCTNLFLSFLSPSHLLSPPLHPRVTPCPNSSMQNRAGGSSLADQNALFSEFSPFTRGEREAASLGPPEPCGDQNTTPTCRAGLYGESVAR